MAGDLTDTQRAVLEALQRRSQRGDPAPTYRELCAEFGWASTGSARDHLYTLARKGHLTLAEGRARQVRLTNPEPRLHDVPLWGRADGTTRRLSVPGAWIESAPHFAVVVKDRHMLASGIVVGDVVVARQQETAPDGSLVVVELAVKKLSVRRLRRRGGSQWVEADARSVKKVSIERIEGIVVWMLRDLTTKIVGSRDSTS